VIAKFANAQPLLGTNWRPKRATGHRPRFVEFTIPGLRIKGGAGLVVGEFSESLFGKLSLI
jgi:hypothetical protein